MAETAIIMTVLLMLVLGIIDFGRALYTYNFVTQSARQGARWLIVRGPHCNVLDHCNATTSGDPNDLQTYVRSLSVGATDVAAITTTATFSPPSSCSTTSHPPPCNVTVTASYPFHFMLMPFLPNLGITMSGSSTMQVAN